MRISILGCGWLGLPLGKLLLAEGFLVKGSTTSVDKLPVLREVGIEPFLVLLQEHTENGAELAAFLEDTDVLIIAIPPGLRQQSLPSTSFVDKINNLIPGIIAAAIPSVLFISSTSVYGGNSGLITDETVALPNTESGRQLLATEALLQQHFAFATTILRFGGLIGTDRNPAKMLAGKLAIPQPNGYVNLIHLEDCLGILLLIIQKNAWGLTLNAVTPNTYTRSTYYTQQATALQLPLPIFAKDDTSLGKKILTSALDKNLGYTFLKTL